MIPRTGLPKPLFDGRNAAFLNGARGGQLLLPQCKDCHQLMAPPAANCVACLSENIEWVPSSGTGTIFSFIEYYRAWIPEFEAYLPYNVAIIQLDDGPRLVSNVLVEEGIDLKIGQPVKVAFEDRGESSVPVFVPAAA